MRSSAPGLARALVNLTGLKSMHLQGNLLGPEGMDKLAPALRKLTSLEQLVLGQNKLLPEGSVALATALMQMKRLKRLDVGINFVSIAGASAVTAVLRGLPEFTTFVVAVMNDLSKEDVDALTKSFLPKVVQLL